MEDKITYGVFWRTTDNKEWNEFSTWFIEFDGACKSYTDVLTNQRCIQAKIVERVETFNDVVVSKEN